MIRRERVHPGTRGRVLEAAAEVFARGGFRAATVREICAKAGANVASVNYHFGSKEALYEELLRTLIRRALEDHPPLMGLSDDAPGEEKLRAFVLSFLRRTLGDPRTHRAFAIMMHEMVDPTPALDVVVRHMARPMFELLSDIVAEVAGRPLPEPVKRTCAAGVVGQCLFYRFAQPVIQRVGPELKPDPRSLEPLARHIADFSIAGIRAVAQAHSRHPAKGH